MSCIILIEGVLKCTLCALLNSFMKEEDRYLLWIFLFASHDNLKKKSTPKSEYLENVIKEVRYIPVKKYTGFP